MLFTIKVLIDSANNFTLCMLVPLVYFLLLILLCRFFKKTILNSHLEPIAYGLVEK